MRTVILYFCFVFYMAYILSLKLKLNYIKKYGTREQADEYTFKVISNCARNIINKIGVKVSITGSQNIPKAACVFISNYQGNFDPIIMLACINKFIGFIAKDEMRRVPVANVWMKEMHCVFMDRKSVRKSLKAINEGIENIKKGYSMVIFPEGTITKCHRMLEFKRGSFKLALKSNSLIVPVAIDGSYKIFEENRGRKLIPAHVRLIIDKPIDVKKLNKEQQKSLPQTVKAIIEHNLNR